MASPEDTQPRTPKAVAIKGANPDHGEGGQSAPKIVAKGSGALAEKILDIAFAEGVKVRQDKDLTELLDAFDVESPIPLEALHTVSLILERVYAENNKMMDQAGGENTGETSSGFVAPAPHTLDGQTGEVVTDGGNNNAQIREDRPDG